MKKLWKWLELFFSLIAFYLMNLSCISIEFLGRVTYFFIAYVMLVYKNGVQITSGVCGGVFNTDPFQSYWLLR